LFKNAVVKQLSSFDNEPQLPMTKAKRAVSHQDLKRSRDPFAKIGKHFDQRVE